MATVVLTDPAFGDLREIRRYIARDSIRYADRMVARIIVAARGLQKFPFAGRVVPEMDREDVRQVLVGRYRVIYLIREDEVRVAMILHSARLLDTEELLDRL